MIFTMWFWILGWFLSVIAVLGNGFAMYLIISKQRLHTTANLFIASLAAADLCVGLSYFPPLFVSNFYYKIDVSHEGVLFKLSFTFLYFSTSNLCVLTADRYIAITRPLRYSTVFMTTKLVQWLILSAWLSPLLLFSLPAMFTYNDNKTYTTVAETFRVIIFQVIPCVVFVVVTVRLLHLSRQMSRQTAILTAQIRFNHQLPAVSVKHNSDPNKKTSMAMVLLVITIFNVAHIAANYRCFCRDVRCGPRNPKEAGPLGNYSQLCCKSNCLRLFKARHQKGTA